MVKICCMFTLGFDKTFLEEVEPELYRCKKCGALFIKVCQNHTTRFYQVDNYEGNKWETFPFISD